MVNYLCSRSVNRGPVQVGRLCSRSGNRLGWRAGICSRSDNSLYLERQPGFVFWGGTRSNSERVRHMSHEAMQRHTNLRPRISPLIGRRSPRRHTSSAPVPDHGLTISGRAACRFKSGACNHLYRTFMAWARPLWRVARMSTPQGNLWSSLRVMKWLSTRAMSSPRSGRSSDAQADDASGRSDARRASDIWVPRAIAGCT